MERFLDDLKEASANNQSLLTIIMPNGKTLRDCAFDELSDIIERLMELGAKGDLKGAGANRFYGCSVLTEAL
jgi:hypothetical protein